MQTLTRWFNRFDLQSRLFTIFSLLFLFVALVLVVFLYTSGSVIGINAQARQVYESARSTYQLQTLLQKMELAHNTYLADEDFNARGDFFAYSAALRGQIAQIKAEQLSLSWEGVAPDAAALGQLEALRQQYESLFTDMTLLMDDEAYDQAYEVDAETFDLLDQMYTYIDDLNVQRNAELADIQESADWFYATSLLMVVVSLPVFLIITLFAVIIIHFQINTPLEKLLYAARSLGSRQFDPRSLGSLTARSDEIGLLANGFNEMAAAVLSRESELRTEAEKYRAKIR